MTRCSGPLDPLGGATVPKEEDSSERGDNVPGQVLYLTPLLLRPPGRVQSVEDEPGFTVNVKNRSRKRGIPVLGYAFMCSLAREHAGQSHDD